MDPRMIEEMKKREAMKRQSKVAQSTASATPIQPAQHAAPPGMAGGGQSPLQQAGMQIGKKLLGSALGPLGGLIGGLFNEGGKVPMQGYNQGGWLQALWGKPKQQRPNNLQQTGKYTYTSKQPTQMGRGTNSNLNKQRLQQTSQAFGNRNQNAWSNLKKGLGFNQGGMVGPLNPQGYNEGGMAQETPMKRVMDEQKLEQQAVAFDKDEMRKQEKHTQDMKIKQQQFQEAQKMKKAAASTNKKPKAPLSK